MDDKNWYLAAGGKTVGPMTLERVRERVAAGRITPKTKAFKDGMPGWLPLSEIPDLAAAASGATGGSTTALEGAPAAPAASPAPAAPSAPETSAAAEAPAPGQSPSPTPTPSPDLTPKPPARAGIARKGPGKPQDARKPLEARKALASAKTASTALGGPSAAPGAPAAPLTPFLAPHRIERAELWTAFRHGFAPGRIVLALLTFGATVGVMIGLVVTAGIVDLVHPILALPVGLAALVLVPATALVGTGALAYHTRRRLTDGVAPSVKECLRFARDNALPLSAVPFGVTIAALAPVVLLAALSLLLRIPYAGPVLTGLMYGVHIALGVATLFLGVAAALSWNLAPVIAAFEGTTPPETARLLLGFVRRSAVRFVAWSILPGLGLAGFAIALLLAGALALAIPLTINAAVGGGLSGVGEILRALPLPGAGGGRAPRSRTPDLLGSLESESPRPSARPSPRPAPAERAAAPAPREAASRGESRTAPVAAASAPAEEGDLTPLADVITDPASFDGRVVSCDVWWRGWDAEDGARVSGPTAINEVVIDIHPLGARKNGAFLDGIGRARAAITFKVEVIEGGWRGTLLAVRLAGASTARSVYPTDDELAAEAAADAKEAAEDAAREEARKATAAALKEGVEAAIAAKDLSTLDALRASKEWRSLAHGDELALEKAIRSCKLAVAGETLVAEVKALLAAEDYLAAEAKVKWLKPEQTAQAAIDEARKLVKAHGEALSARAQADKVRTVTLDDGAKIAIDLGEWTNYILVTRLEVTGRPEASPKAKKPFEVTIEYRWIHAHVNELMMDGSTSLVTQKAVLSKDLTSVKLVFDQALMRSGKATLTTRSR